ncbi:MAG: undecaprenyldiphospho-muramoylpentapeptide beta-N-acetylglucosaminyltransferase [bacterium]|nr:undecaprenyldiphospho-muramoylpentapeptide beta-N-acetylglucosaminyltransferase [bacterium]
MNRLVVIAGGGTGGHIFPGLAVAEALSAVEVDVHWLGVRRGLEAELVAQHGIPISLVDLEGIHGRSSAAVLRVAGQLPAAASAALSLLANKRPFAVLGVGGYASAAGVAAAGMLGIPWVLQEQNSIPGWTNRSLAPWADSICCGFEDALGYFQSLPSEWTGNPVRPDFFSIEDLVPHDPPRLLVLGGSQGSLFLNQTVPRALALMRSIGTTLEVRHQAGPRWADVVQTSYQDLALEASVCPFLDEPWQSLSNADVVIARAGALTVSELAAAGRPSLLIPFGAAAANHQEFNARSMQRAGGSLVITEAEAAPDHVAAELDDLLRNSDRLITMARNARSVAREGAATRIAAKILAIGGVL